MPFQGQDPLPAEPMSSDDLSPRVMLMIDTSGTYGRGVIRGISKYAHIYGPWRFLSVPPLAHAVDAMASWQVSGIIAGVNQELAAPLAKLSIPIINISGAFADLGFPRVCANNLEIGRLAAREFLSCGFRLFAYYGITNTASSQRLEGFQEQVEEAGFSCQQWIQPQPAAAGSPWRWENIQRDLGQWLVSLKKPIAILAYNDERGFRLLEACARMRLRVPEEVAVIGVDNDETFCNLATPALSSVDLPLEQIGFEAARVLDQWITGQAPPTQPVQLAPKGVIIRPSCDTLAIEDTVVSQALTFIRRHAHEAMGVERVLKDLPISRRNLERRFRELLKRSPREEILRVRIERAKQLLRDTDLKVSLVATRSGFAAKLFAGIFRRATGTTPVAYRKRQRLT